jgi:Domain of unknown function (DUF4281)
MTAAQVFSIANTVALLGWVVLVASVLLNKPLWRDVICGRWLPLGFSAVYALLILFFFAQADGGFGSLAEVQQLFTNQWAALAGWVHYLAFDLFMGSIIAKRVIEEGLPRLLLIVLLPLTFMFGPIGYLGFETSRLLFGRARSTQTL